MNQALDYQLVGWLGLTVRVPSHWDLVLAKGNRFDGLLRFDEESFTRCHIQWTLVSAGKVALDEQLERYLELFARQLKKKGTPVRIRRDVGLVTRKDVHRNVRTFAWEDSTIGYGMLWFCDQCRRALLAQVYGFPHENVRSIAKRIFLSLSDHPAGEWEHWSVYGATFDVPAGWDLTESQIAAGKLRLHFRKGPWSFSMERWGPASALLTDSDMESFILRALSEETRRQFTLYCRPDAVKGHSALRLVGSHKFAKRPLALLWRQLTSGQPFPRFIGVLWVCPVSNRVYLVSGSVSPSDEQAVERVIESVICHDEGMADR